LISRSFVALIVCGLWGCGQGAKSKPAEQPVEPETRADRPPGSEASPELPAGHPAQPAPKPVSEEALKTALKEKNHAFEGEVAVGSDGRSISAVEVHDPAIEDVSPLAGLPLRGLDLARCHVTDIRALEGMPLTELYLEGTGVQDIGALKGMPLVKLYLSDSGVDDISPLRGAQRLQELNLVGTKVSDLGPLRGMRRLELLWLTGCPVSDLGPLAEVPSLVSLTVAETKVSDLSPLKGHPSLRRLHIARTEVTDLAPLEWLQLTRLIFTPGRIKAGLEFARRMETLEEIDVEFPSPRGKPMSPAEFWQRYDAGELK
jgi:internalin A